MGREHHIICKHPFDLSDMENLAREISKALGINVWYGYEQNSGPLEGLLHPHCRPIYPKWLESAFVVLHKVVHPDAEVTALLYADDHMYGALGKRYGTDDRVTKGFQQIFGNDAEGMAAFYATDQDEPYISLHLYTGEYGGCDFGAWIEKGAIQWSTGHFSGWSYFQHTLSRHLEDDELHNLNQFREFAFTVAKKLNSEKVYYTMGSRGYEPLDTWEETEANLLEKANGEVVDMVALLKMPAGGPDPDQFVRPEYPNMYVDDFRDLKHPSSFQLRKHLRPLTTFERYTMDEHWPVMMAKDLLGYKLRHMENEYAKLRQRNDTNSCHRVTTHVFIQSVRDALIDETAVRSKLKASIEDELLPMLSRRQPIERQEVYDTARKLCLLTEDLIRIEQRIQLMLPPTHYLQQCGSIILGFTRPVFQEVKRFHQELGKGDILHYYPATGFRFLPGPSPDAELVEAMLCEAEKDPVDERAENKWTGQKLTVRERSNTSVFKQVQDMVTNMATRLMRTNGIFRSKKRYLLFSGHISGTRYYEANEVFGSMSHHDALQLHLEPNNPYDLYAIEVFWNKRKLGYVPRENNRPIHDHIHNGETILARYVAADNAPAQSTGLSFEVFLSI